MPTKKSPVARPSKTASGGKKSVSTGSSASTRQAKRTVASGSSASALKAKKPATGTKSASTPVAGEPAASKASASTSAASKATKSGAARGESLPKGARARLGVKAPKSDWMAIRTRPVMLPDGSQVVTLGEGALEVWDVATGERLRTLATGQETNRPALSSGTRQVAFHDDGRVQIIALDGGDRPVWTSDTLSACDSVAFSDDGTLLAVGTRVDDRPVVIVWNVREGREHLRLDGYKEPVEALSFSPDGKRLGVGSTKAIGKGLGWDSSVWIVDTTTGTKKKYPVKDCLIGLHLGDGADWVFGSASTYARAGNEFRSLSGPWSAISRDGKTWVFQDPFEEGILALSGRGVRGTRRLRAVGKPVATTHLATVVLTRESSTSYLVWSGEDAEPA